MKRSKLSKIIGFALLAALLGGGCSQDSSEFSSRTYRIPFPDANGVYSLREIELKTYQEPEKFRGDVAQVFVEPHEAGGQLSGEQPVGRYIKTTGNVIVPADFNSLQATTVYAHMERLKELDESLGVANEVRWPLKIGIQTQVVDQGRGVNNNAVYDGRLDALLIVPYTGTGLPIAMNAGVLAHEHFHVIYQSFVLSKVKEKAIVVGKPGRELDMHLGHDCAWVDSSSKNAKPRRREVFKATIEDEEVEKAAEEIPKRVFNGFLLRALNEGVADFWGWVYTGDVNFIELSLPREGGIRRLDYDSGRLPSGKTIRRSLVDLRRADKVRTAESRVTLAYLLGTQYARFLRETALELTGSPNPGFEARQRAARVVLETLPSIALMAATEYDQSYLSPNFLLKPLTLRLGSVSLQGCERLEKFKAEDKSFELPPNCPKKPETRAEEEAPVLVGGAPS